MSDVFRVRVLLQLGEPQRFERSCQNTGHKKSILIARWNLNPERGDSDG